ncbi:DVUA0089 family protein [Paucibacter sp. APW11]|uniref:DVUA0089 family protein n=1 Tax=Roseateles aquae TaxID=3077235 RepID=A0ABU3P794_9BURK|nr:DVUA0089 family protein [Paucibacter sp. APW11]MDT8998424.1 DVUA0089 family protein [Paucibacter sp. APW11]
MHPSTVPMLAALALSLGLGSAQADSRSYSGSFQTDDELFTTSFTLTGDDLFSAISYSFAGGSNAAGSSIAAGGFAPVLALFEDQLGLVQLVRGSSTVCGAGSAIDPQSGFCWDARMSVSLTAGHYTLVLSQDGNEPLGQLLSDGYSQSGVPDYTGQFYLGQAGQHFVMVDGSQRSGAFALDIQAAAIPEPASAALLSLGLLALLRRRREQ